MPVRLKKGRLVASVDHRRSYAETAAHLPVQPRADVDGPDPSMLRTWRHRVLAEGLVLALSREAKAQGREVLTPREAKASKLRRDRAASSLARYPEGRAMLASASERIASPVVRGTIRELARVWGEGLSTDARTLVGQLLDAVEVAERVITDYRIASPTGQDYGISHGIWKARETQASARAMALKFDTRSIAVRETDDKKSTTFAASILKDTSAIATTASSRSEYALRTAWEAEHRWRDEQMQVAREKRMQRVLQPNTTTTPAPALERGNTITTSAPTVAELVHDDAERTGFRSGEGDHGRSREAVTSAPLERDDLSAERDPGATSHEGEPSAEEPEEPEEPSLADLQAFVCDAIPDPRRGNRLVPKYILDRPPPSAADGPDWRQRQDFEAAELNAWDRQRSNAAHQMRTRGKR